MSAREQIIPVFVPHLGCPHDCVFCNQRRITGQLKPATAEMVRRAVREARKVGRTGVKRQLAFYGGSFTAIPLKQQTELLEAAKAAMDAGEIDGIRLSTRPDAISEEIASRLRTYGVDTVELGAQSMDDEVLRLSGRGHSAADVDKASQIVKAAGLSLILQMMTGLPGDRDEKSIETAKKLIALRPDGVRIYPTVIVRDTALYELWQRGAYREHSVEDAVRVCARLLPLFEAARIPVIRLGLNPTEELSAVAAVAGAYHPALGELVKSRVYFEEAVDLLRDVEPGSRVVLAVAPEKLSQMLGQRRENVRLLTERFSLKELKVITDQSFSGRIRVEYVEKPDSTC